MPTAAKLVAALCFAALAYVVSELIKPLMPASTVLGYFSIVNAGIGLLCGWIIVGSRAGRGSSAAISNGVTGTVALVFWGLFIHATNEMVANAFARKYRTMVEATVSIFEIGIEYGTIMLDVRVILTLLAGGIVAGMLAEFAAGRWR
jgi:hypothetical protein